MGDRTWVRLRVPLSLRAKAEAIIVAIHPCDEIGEYQADDKLGTTFHYVEFGYDEVNYGQLTYLNQLTEAGIPYDSEWGNGGNYEGGTEHSRFAADGEIVLKENYANCENPSLTELLSRIDQPQALRTYILAHQEQRSVLPWDNQEEYAKLYLINRLLTT